jgi:hypothetical protein
MPFKKIRKKISSFDFFFKRAKKENESKNFFDSHEHENVHPGHMKNVAVLWLLHNLDFIYNKF